MTTRPKLKWWIWSFVILLVAALIYSVVFGMLWLIQLPTVQQQAKALSGMQVFITSPGNRTTWPADAAIPIQAFFQSEQPIQGAELYVDGQAVASQSAEANEITGILSFVWQPAGTGDVTLLVRVTTAEQKSIVSEPLILTISAPVGAIAEIAAPENASLDQIAQTYNADPQAIVEDNPQVDFSQPLSAGTMIRVPIQLSTATAQPPVATPAPQVSPVFAQVEQQSIFQILDYYLGAKAKNPHSAPSAPTLQAQTVGCNVQLSIGDTSSDESGFFVYRSDESSTNLTRIVTLVANPSNQGFTYVDPGQSGKLTYVVASYNDSGENQSQPVSAAPDASVCPASKPPGQTSGNTQYNIVVVKGPLVVENHIIKFPQVIDLAYLYISINQRDWERIPAGNLKFLPGSVDQFNLDDYLDQMIMNIPDTNLEILMELWGWSGGKLVSYGTVKVTVERTVLRICGIANIDCGDDLLRTEIFLPPASYLPDLSYMFTWDTANYDQLKDVWFQIATHPFTGDEIGQVNGLISSSFNEIKNSKIKYKFSSLFNDEPYKDGQWKYGTLIYKSNFFQYAYPYPETSFTLYARVLAYGDHRLSTSNTVILHYRTDKTTEAEPVYASDLPSLYDIRFLPETYSAPTLLREDRWGCIILNSDVFHSYTTILKFYGFNQLDFNADGENCTNPVAPTCNKKPKPLIYPAGTTICPANYTTPSGFWNDLKSLASGIWSGLTSSWDSLVTAFEKAKQALTDQIASVIPGCGNICKAAIKKGLEAGFTALTGIPPSLPTYDALKEQGIAYAVEMVVEQVGPDCDDTCKAIIEKGIRETIKVAESNQSAPGCLDSGAAHAHGKEPLCFPTDPRIKWAPAPGAVYQPAVISLQVTRKSIGVDSLQPQQLGTPLNESDKYRIWIDSLGYNDTRIGDWFPICGFQEGLDGSNATGYTDPGGGYSLKRQIDDPLQGPLYNPLEFLIPALSAGQSITIPIGFSPEQFLRINHEYDVSQAQVSFQDFLNNCGDDWPYLYYDGLTTLNAVEQCLNPMGEWVACSGGGQDTFKTQNPSAQ